MRVSRREAAMIAGVMVALASAVTLQAARDRAYPRDTREVERMLYVRSGAAMTRIALSYDALAADVYWIRAIQHYGGDRLAREQPGRKYDLLHPLLDLTTTLDPYFMIAYRFGAIFLGEPYPGGPGRPDQAIALLQKAIAKNPQRWEYYHDIAFVHYWRLGDAAAAARWFQRGAEQPDSPGWLEPVAAAVLAGGGDRRAARFLWQQMLNSEQEWVRRSAERSLLQLDALDQIDEIETLIRNAPAPPGGRYSWADLQRRGVLPGMPVDRTRTPFDIDPVTGDVSLSTRSPLYPLPPFLRQPRR